MSSHDERELRTWLGLSRGEAVASVCVILLSIATWVSIAANLNGQAEQRASSPLDCTARALPPTVEPPAAGGVISIGLETEECAARADSIRYTLQLQRCEVFAYSCRWLTLFSVDGESQMIVPDLARVVEHSDVHCDPDLQYRSWARVLTRRNNASISSESSSSQPFTLC